jgi:hypothetical protein
MTQIVDLTSRQNILPAESSFVSYSLGAMAISNIFSEAAKISPSGLPGGR